MSFSACMMAYVQIYRYARNWQQRVRSSSVGCGSAVKIQPLPSRKNHILDYNQGITLNRRIQKTL